MLIILFENNDNFFYFIFLNILVKLLLIFYISLTWFSTLIYNI